MMVRFILKRYSYNTGTTINEIGASIIDIPVPEEVNIALSEGYLLTDVNVVNDITNQF